MRWLLLYSGWMGLAAVAPAADKVKPLPANPALKPVMVQGLSWSGDLAAALEQAAKEKKPVFIDFTGETCTNCKLNEKKVFPLPAVKQLLGQFVRVQLYTDTVPQEFYKSDPGEDQREKDALANQDFHKKVFKTEQLPHYIIVRPEGGGFVIFSEYNEGRINQVDGFLQFLKKPFLDK